MNNEAPHAYDYLYSTKQCRRSHHVRVHQTIQTALVRVC
jgi:hypothetical protein